MANLWYQNEDSRVMQEGENAVGDLGRDEGLVASGKVTVNGLYQAAEWLATFSAEALDKEEKQELFDTYVWLMEEAERRVARKNLNAAKRAFAEKHGIPVRSVRVKKGA